MARPRKNAAAGEARVTKTSAVREALEALGAEAMPADIHGFVLERRGIDMSLNHISNIKSSLKGTKGKRRRKGKVGRPKGSGAAQPVAAPVVVAAAPNGRKQGGIEVEDVAATLNLVKKVGSSNLLALINLVAKTH
jgi:hypothetical protein